MLSASTGDCSQPRAPGKPLLVGVCAQMLIKYSLLLLCSARWKHSAQGEVTADAVALTSVPNCYVFQMHLFTLHLKY